MSGSEPTDGGTPEIYEAGEYDSVLINIVKVRKLAVGNR